MEHQEQAWLVNPNCRLCTDLKEIEKFEILIKISTSVYVSFFRFAFTAQKQVLNKKFEVLSILRESTLYGKIEIFMNETNTYYFQAPNPILLVTIQSKEYLHKLILFQNILLKVKMSVKYCDRYAKNKSSDL